MIYIMYSTASEFLWMYNVVESGVLNGDTGMKKLKEEFGVNSLQNVRFVPNYDYENDIGEKFDEYYESIIKYRQGE